MKKLSFFDINILDIGNTIQMAGTVWAGKGICFITPGPNSLEEFEDIQLMKLTIDEWKTLLRQTDLLETEIFGQDSTGIVKTLYRKSQRQIDSVIQWRVFKRDNYTCRYCNRTGIPLTVDHIDLWEHGGLTTEDNLISACKQCNKDRGNMPYKDWLDSPIYKKRSINLPSEIKSANEKIIQTLPYLETLRVTNIRTR